MIQILISLPLSCAILPDLLGSLGLNNHQLFNDLVLQLTGTSIGLLSPQHHQLLIIIKLFTMFINLIIPLYLQYPAIKVPA